MTTLQMRNLIAGVYNSKSWKDKVAKMSDGQVFAIYNDFLAKGKFNKPRSAARKPAVKETPKQCGYTTQLSFFDEIPRKEAK